METSASALIHFVHKHYPGYSIECCYESCCLGYHIYRDLTKAGWNVLVVNPGDIPRINKQNSSKTDKIDSRYLCNQLAYSHIKGIYVPYEKQEQFEVFFAEGLIW
jgi:transposase